jgi:tetratricopeptide (TPR) repeat protein
MLALAPVAAGAETVQKALVHHQVSTANPAAQELFDEGLTLVYAFSRGEAQKRFREAAAADPKLAIAWWGVALAAGPNLNYGMTAENWKTVAEALKNANALSANATPEEQRLITAVATRYPAGAKEPDGKKYRDAMAAVYKDYPSDDDVATLYVESVMDVDDWGYDSKGKPIGKTAELSDILKTVITHNYLHPGANHYFVHLHDYTSVAKDAILEADRLANFPAEPAASHLNHMAGHTYLDVGDYAAIVETGRTAVGEDLEYAKSIGVTPGKLDYFYHNLDFYSGGALMLGDVADAEHGADLELENNSDIALLIYARLGEWSKVLSMGFPDPKMPPWRSAWPYHYARGIAFASEHNLPGAEGELAALRESVGKTGWKYPDLLVEMLSARVDYLRGNVSTATHELRDVIAATSQYPPEAFPAWYFPAGEWLGWMLLQSGDTSGAEAAFRAELMRTPHSVRVLIGLIRALNDQGRTSEAGTLGNEATSEWQGTSIILEKSI